MMKKRGAKPKLTAAEQEHIREWYKREPKAGPTYLARMFHCSPSLILKVLENKAPQRKEGE